MTDMGVARDGSSRLEWEYARREIAIKAKAFGIIAVDTPYVDFKNLEGLKEDCEYLKKIGITARMAIHPSSCQVINEVFSIP